MALAFETVRVNFPSVKGKKQSEDGTAVFANTVRVGDASVKGFHIQYSDDSHHVWQIEIAISNVSVKGTAVSFWVDFLIQDKGGDDPYEGWVDVLVTADVE